MLKDENVIIQDRVARVREELAADSELIHAPSPSMESLQQIQTTLAKVRRCVHQYDTV